MEYIEHGDLGSCLKMPLPEDEARDITFQVLEGLEHMHKSGYVHRDLKPDVSMNVPFCYTTLVGTSNVKERGAKSNRTYLL